MIDAKPKLLTRWVMNPPASRLPSRGVQALTVASRRRKPHPVQVGGSGPWESPASQAHPVRWALVVQRASVIEEHRIVAGRTVEQSFRPAPDPLCHPVVTIRAEPST